MKVLTPGRVDDDRTRDWIVRQILAGRVECRIRWNLGEPFLRSRPKDA